MPPYGIPRRFATKTEETIPLNWRRGMIRIWLVLSAAWIMGWIIEFLVYGLQGGFKFASDYLAGSSRRIRSPDPKRVTASPACWSPTRS